MSTDISDKYATTYEPVQGMDVVYRPIAGTFSVGDMVLETVIAFDQNDYKFYKFHVDGKVIPVHIKYEKATRTYTLVDIESPIFRGIADASGPMVPKYIYLNNEDKKNMLQQVLFVLDIWVRISENNLVNNIEL
ncbi:hypothetical protein [uncultured Thalassolituus sp.]|uniref:hypothetical protein n=1 Tax=uncultured Thalassolituus sp. TaxID=285273 RepID=UPI0026352D55|nr:hypothetical protein [uncultured Thalassolituus sp.]